MAYITAAVFFQFTDRRIAGKQTLDHVLKESILCRKLAVAAQCDFANLINGITFLTVLTGQSHVDVVLAQPF